MEGISLSGQGIKVDNNQYEACENEMVIDSVGSVRRVDYQ